jgi:hypothetical protein
MTTPNASLPQQIYLVHHAEKPADPPTPSHGHHASPSGPPFGVDVDGNRACILCCLWTGAREVLRTLSYYEMKNRAGLIGQQGLGPLLANLAGPSGAPRIHLIGHSFGARLVCLRPVRC